MPEDPGISQHLKAAHETVVPPVGNGRPAGGGDCPTARHQTLRRALQNCADTVMLSDDAVEAANEALAALRAELVYRFDLLRSRQRQPALIDPAPLPPPSAP